MSAEGTVSTQNGIRIWVDRDLCFGFGDCVDTAPEVFELDDEEVSIVKDADGADRATTLQAAGDCPVDAIFVYDAESGEQLFP
ncbi:MAG: ferredoxin [Actinobacteria bacterium]|nr:ferredoxin [Actinomycetota bacterium]